VRWLGDLAALAEAAAARGELGIFGTSIAAVWLYARLGSKIRFFVDEDPSRVGKTLFGLPVHAPASAPRGSIVLLALVPEIARAVAGRLAQHPFEVLHPPPLSRA